MNYHIYIKKKTMFLWILLELVVKVKAPFSSYIGKYYFYIIVYQKIGRNLILAIWQRHALKI